MIIGTRGSKLALVQTEMVRAQLATHYPDLITEVVRITTVGDQVQDRSLASIGGKALFVAEIEAALREGRIHVAVHSAKDIPAELPDDMRIAAYLPRADPRDALVARSGRETLASLPLGARVGTNSPRRACQLRMLRPDLRVVEIRGNVDTRLAKLARGDFDAIVLAVAGLTRLGLPYVATEFIPTETMLPCGGQGAVAIEAAAADAETIRLLSALDDRATRIAVDAERAFLAAIGGSCTTPLAVHARLEGDDVQLRCMVGSFDGRAVALDARGAATDAIALATDLAARALADGGGALLGRLTAASAG